MSSLSFLISLTIPGGDNEKGRATKSSLPNMKLLISNNSDGFGGTQVHGKGEKGVTTKMLFGNSTLAISKIKKAPASIATREEPIKIGHMVSFARCGPGLMTKYQDAMLVLRHSIHQNSVHTNKQSKYSYQMYAFINQDEKCQQYEERIQQLGYIPLLRPIPVNISAIQNEWYRKTIVSPPDCAEYVSCPLRALTIL
jgi:hypothetical protein